MHPAVWITCEGPAWQDDFEKLAKIAYRKFHEHLHHQADAEEVVHECVLLLMEVFRRHWQLGARFVRQLRHVTSHYRRGDRYLTAGLFGHVRHNRGSTEPLPPEALDRMPGRGINPAAVADWKAALAEVEPRLRRAFRHLVSGSGLKHSAWVAGLTERTFGRRARSFAASLAAV